MANYKVGDEIVCIISSPVGEILMHGTGLKTGGRYRALEIRRNACCGAETVRVDVPIKGKFAQCICGNRQYPSHSFRGAWRFIKLDGFSTDESEHQETPIKESA